MVKAVMEQVDDDLKLLLLEWEGLSDIAVKINSWPLDEQLDFTESWALKEQCLLRMKGLAARGLLSEQQQALFARVLNAETQNRSLLQSILNQPAK